MLRLAFLLCSLHLDLDPPYRYNTTSVLFGFRVARANPACPIAVYNPLALAFDQPRPERGGMFMVDGQLIWLCIILRGPL